MRPIHSLLVFFFTVWRWRFEKRRKKNTKIYLSIFKKNFVGFYWNVFFLFFSNLTQRWFSIYDMYKNRESRFVSKTYKMSLNAFCFHFQLSWCYGLYELREGKKIGAIAKISIGCLKQPVSSRVCGLCVCVEHIERKMNRIWNIIILFGIYNNFQHFFSLSLSFYYLSISFSHFCFIFLDLIHTFFVCLQLFNSCFIIIIYNLCLTVKKLKSFNVKYISWFCFCIFSIRFYSAIYVCMNLCLYVCIFISLFHFYIL